MNRKLIVKTPSDMDKYVNILEQLGFTECTDFYTEEVYDVEIIYEARQRIVVTQSEYEDGDYEFDVENIEIEDKIFDEATTIGEILTDIDGNQLDLFHKIFKIDFKKNQCVICGKKLIASKYMDNRKEEDGLKCFDHRGIHIDKSRIKENIIKYHKSTGFKLPIWKPEEKKKDIVTEPEVDGELERYGMVIA